MNPNLLKNEATYHACVAVLSRFSSGSYNILIDPKAGQGYLDLALIPKHEATGSKAFIFEFKWDSSSADKGPRQTLKLLPGALDQIHKKRYDVILANYPHIENVIYMGGIFWNSLLTLSYEEGEVTHGDGYLAEIKMTSEKKVVYLDVGYKVEEIALTNPKLAELPGILLNASRPSSVAGEAKGSYVFAGASASAGSAEEASAEDRSSAEDEGSRGRKRPRGGGAGLR